MKDSGYTHIGTNASSRLAHFLELLLPRFVDHPPARQAIAALLNERGNGDQTLAQAIR
jgi:hypothetical protein